MPEQEPKFLVGPVQGGVYDSWNHINDGLPEDIEVALQTITVRLPEEPMKINGTPYGFSVDESLLAGAINMTRKKSAEKGLFEPAMLEVTLGESLHPDIGGSIGSPNRLIYDRRQNMLRIKVPKEIVKTEASHEVLARKVEMTMDHDLKFGLLESKSAGKQESSLKTAYIATLLGGTAVGEGVGIALFNENIGQVVTCGIAGGSVGALIALIASVAHDAHRVKKHGSAVDEQQAYRYARQVSPPLNARLREYTERGVFSLKAL